MYAMQRFERIEIYAEPTTINIPLRLLDDVKNDKLRCQMLALSICIKCKYGDSLMRNASVSGIMELLHCGYSTAKTLFNAVQSSNLFKYSPYTKTLLARNFKKKYTNKVETRYGTSFMMYRVSLDRKDYTLRSLIKEFKHLLFENAVNAKERRDEFKRNGKNKNTTSFTTDYALTQNYLAKKIGVKSRMAVYRLAKELQSSYTLSVTKTPAKMVLENLDEFTPNPTKHYIYDAKSGLMFEFSSNEYNLNSRKETERFGNVIFNHKKRQTKYHKKGSVDEYYERYFH